MTEKLEWKTINMADVMACPNVILLPSHYRDDGSCRCNEKICEYEGCNQLKWKGEIYCKRHCE